MKKFGKQFFSEMKEYKRTLKEVNGNAVFKSVNGVPVIQCLDISPSDSLPRILSQKKRGVWMKGGIAVFPNNRKEGAVSLKRFDNDRRVDFRRLPKNDEQISFIHHSGFFAVINPIGDLDIDYYIKKATRI